MLGETKVLTCEITNKCNMNCTHCCIGNDKRKEPTLNMLEETVEKTAWYCKDIRFGGGEPLLKFDYLKRLLKLAIELGASPTFTTNCVLLNDEMIKELVEIGIEKIQVSLDGIKTYEKQRQPKCVDKVIKNIKKIVDSGIQAYVPMCISKLNYTEVEEVIKLCAGLGVSVVKLFPVVPMGRAGKDLMVDPLTLKTVLTEAKHLGSELGIKVQTPKMFSKDEDAYYCRAGVDFFHADTEGNISPCMFLRDIILGNIHTQDFKEIIKNGKRFHKMNLSQVDDECLKCEYFEKCRTGCWAMSYAYNGKLLGKDPYCWRCLE